jgi:hypothetical protein
LLISRRLLVVIKVPNLFKVFFFFVVILRAHCAFSMCMGGDDWILTGKFEIVDKKAADFKPINAKLAEKNPKGCFLKLKILSVRENISELENPIEVFSSSFVCEESIGKISEVTLSTPCCDVIGLDSIDDHNLACKSGRRFISEIRVRKIKTGFLEKYSEGNQFKTFENVSIQKFDGDERYYRRAGHEKNEKLCKKIYNLNLQRMCIDLVFKNVVSSLESESDAKFCNSLENSSRCMGILAEKLKKPKICEKLLRAKNRIDCFRYSNATEADCQTLTSKEFRKSCYSSIKMCEKLDALEQEQCWIANINHRVLDLGAEKAVNICSRFATHQFNCLLKVLQDIKPSKYSVDEAIKILSKTKLKEPEISYIYQRLIENFIGPLNIPVRAICDESTRLNLKKPHPKCPQLR